MRCVRGMRGFGRVFGRGWRRGGVERRLGRGEWEEVGLKVVLFRFCEGFVLGLGMGWEGKRVFGDSFFVLGVLFF